MITIKARFDGRVFVPQEPVNLPADCEIEIALPDAPAAEQGHATLTAHTERGRSIGEMARALDAMGHPVVQESAPLTIDPDDYPLY